ncbi:PREDICTED: UPF0481 protein At3g47200-like [Fragaria vesca subsp. vesca]|uniref:UPF0481 protein At3g47200-like n=1 Tax=Fragaria vesca subsp. vesca TaxID=101020 RepID=UPI0002C311A5|nr:PREDICTED: UPF0481 protein At3g47200-like [Fragaria vesca subsp. vesca]
MENHIERRSDEHDSLIVVKDDNKSTEIVEALEKSMSTMLRSDSPLSAKCCIFRVPEVLRRHKPEAYQPDVVSIGPFHRGGKQFQLMEEVKQWYLQNLLSRLNISLKTLIQGIDNVVEFEKRARRFYAQPLDHISQNEFIEMMILDACFLIELFRKLCFPDNKLSVTGSVQETDTGNDPILNMDCMLQYLCHDLLLLENQIPWFVLECFCNLTAHNSPYPCLTILVLNFFSLEASLASNFKYYSEQNSRYKILHILDLIRTAIVVPTRVFWSSHITSESKLLPANNLSEAGIEFRTRGAAESIMSIDFRDGTFMIPQLAIGELTEPLFRNLIAFEQCYHGRSHKITSYALLMNYLISSSKDMDFLCNKGIMVNWLNSEDASQFFSKLYNDTVLKHFYYGRLCAEVNRYHKITWNKWLEKLKRDYLCNPWKIISLVAAFILLVLTLLQTTYTIFQYYHPRSN